MSAPTHFRARRPAAVIAATLLSTAGCTPIGVDVDPAPPAPMPDEFAIEASDASLPERWWLDINDSELHRLVEAAFGESLQIRAAWARLAQADALAKQAAGGYWPTLSAEGSAGLSESPQPFTGNLERTESYSASLRASYEIDVWGKLNATAQAAVMDRDAARDDLEATVMSLTAEVAEAWFDVVVRHNEQALLAEQLKINETFLELATLRFNQGLAAALDVHQQRQQVEATKAQLARVGAAQALSQHRLAVLLGKPPRADVATVTAVLPALPPPPSVGLPAQLLHRRPDLRAAQRRVVAADARVTAAVANLLPSLRLSGSLGYQATSPADLFNQLIWNVIANLTAPLFEGGRRSAELDRNEAVLEERLQSFGQVMLRALLEVENALAQEKHQRDQITALEAQLEAAEGAVRESRGRYLEGLSDFLPVLTALQSQQRTEQSLLTARRQLLSYRIQLYRALGGTWTAELSEPSAGESEAS